MFVVSIDATTSIAAGTYLCTERIEKFGGTAESAIAAVATAVVSKPLPRNTTSSEGCARGELDRLRDRVDDLHLPALRLRVGERAGGAGQPEHVAVGADAGALRGERDRLVHLRARPSRTPGSPGP